MKKRILLILFTLAAFSFGAFAQGILNDGATITVEDGTVVTITNSGNYTNDNSGHLVLDGNGTGQDGELIVSGNFVNTSGDVDINGVITLSGDFTSVDAGNVFTKVGVGTDGTVVFTGTADQNISNTTANAYIDFENLTVDKTSNTVFLDAGSAATVNGDLTVNAGGTFRLSSPSDGEAPSGSLITNGNVAGAGALYVDRHFETSLRYQYISIPVNNADDDMFDVGYNGAFNPNLYTYDETYDAPVDPPNADYASWTNSTYGFDNAWNQVADEFSTVPLSGNAVGYVTYNNIELDVNFGGSPANLNNASSYSPAITYTLNDDGGDPGAGDYYDGWNIIGNPYPCALDFTLLSLTGINNCVYYWDGDAGNYKYYNNGGTSYDDGSNVVSGGTKYIPAMQSFAIKTTGAAPSITIADADQVHNNQVMWKNKGEKVYGETQYIKLRTEADDYSDETVVRFLEEAITDFDNEYDAFKMFPRNEDIPMIYSLAVASVEYPLAINSLPVPEIGTTVPLGFKTGTAGTFTIQVEDFNFDAETEVKLIDTYDETEIILDENSEYSFTFSGGENRDRFYLFVAPEGVDIEDPQENFETIVNVWSSENNVHITITSSDLIDANVEIFDVLGKSVIQKRLNGTYNVVNVPGASGTYFVKLITNDGKSLLNKVFIQK